MLIYEVNLYGEDDKYIKKKGIWKSMKITIKALLINETNEQMKIIDNMMLIFSTATRYSFKRLLKDKKNWRFRKRNSLQILS